MKRFGSFTQFADRYMHPQYMTQGCKLEAMRIILSEKTNWALYVYTYKAHMHIYIYMYVCMYVYNTYVYWFFMYMHIHLGCACIYM